MMRDSARWAGVKQLQLRQGAALAGKPTEVGPGSAEFGRGRRRVAREGRRAQRALVGYNEITC